MPDEKGKPRRERNDDFGYWSPELIVPEAGEHLWSWYHDLSGRLRRVRDGLCEPIPPSELAAWIALKRLIVYPTEIDILAAMDEAYCDEMNKEIEAYSIRQEEAANKS